MIIEMEYSTNSLEYIHFCRNVLHFLPVEYLLTRSDRLTLSCPIWNHIPTLFAFSTLFLWVKGELYISWAHISLVRTDALLNRWDSLLQPTWLKQLYFIFFSHSLRLVVSQIWRIPLLWSSPLSPLWSALTSGHPSSPKVSSTPSVWDSQKISKLPWTTGCLISTVTSTMHVGLIHKFPWFPENSKDKFVFIYSCFYCRRFLMLYLSSLSFWRCCLYYLIFVSLILEYSYYLRWLCNTFFFVYEKPYFLCLLICFLFITFLSQVVSRMVALKSALR